MADAPCGDDFLRDPEADTTGTTGDNDDLVFHGGHWTLLRVNYPSNDDVERH